MAPIPDPSPDDIRSLTYAEHFCVWALRTSVACSPQCRTLLRECDHALGSGNRGCDNREGLAEYHALIASLGKGGRKVRIGRPGHVTLTPDELSLVAMLSAAQDGDEARFRAHARWIMGHDAIDQLYGDALRFTARLAVRGHRFRSGSAARCDAPSQAGGARPRLEIVT